MSGKRILLIFAALILTSWALPVVLCQNDKPEQTQSSHSQTASKPEAETDEDQTMFYAFLREDPNFTAGPLYDYLKDKPMVSQLVEPRNHLERKFRPMMQWRRWADKHQGFLPSLLFICLTSFLAWSFFPTYLQAAAEECKQSFWKSFGSGLLLSIIAMTLLRTIFISEIGWPLGIVLAGSSQAVMLLGLSVSVFNLGHSMSLLMQLGKIPVLARKPAWARYCDIFTGSVFAALLLQIPQFGAMPRCGTRLLSLFAVLGIGAIYRELKRRQSTLTA